MKYSEKIEIAVPLTNSFETLTSHSWRLLLQKHACSALFYFWIFRELQAIDTKESHIFHNRQRNRYNRETGEEIKNSEQVFLEQLFKCVKILFPQIYLKTAREQLKRVKIPRFPIFTNISYIL